MKSNKAVFCQKPLTQTIYEARYLRKTARERKLVTQMDNQGSSADGLRRAVETIQDGLIGQVHEVHVWTNRPSRLIRSDRSVMCSGIALLSVIRP
jgi:predicted dehydrogenase